MKTVDSLSAEVLEEALMKSEVEGAKTASTYTIPLIRRRLHLQYVVTAHAQDRTLVHV